MRVRRAVIVAAALALAVFPVPPRVIERAYATSFYRLAQPVLTSLSNLVPFALFDVIVGGVVAAWLALGVWDILGVGWWRAFARAVLRTVTWGAAVYLLFLVTWGFNYRRERLMDRLAFDPSAVNDEAVVRLAAAAVQQLNATYARAHAEGWPAAGTIDPALAGAFERTQGDLAGSRPAVQLQPVLSQEQVGRSQGFQVSQGSAAVAGRVTVGRPKHTVFDWYFRRAGVDGLTDPFMLETLIASDLLPFERPFVVAHEWSHLAGLADEGEANFGGWLVCMRGSVADQYSGWVFLYGELVRLVRPRDRETIVARLGPGPRDDLRAIRDRIRRHVDPRVSAAGFRIYDSYLKANRVEAGNASYAEVVKLVLGLRAAQL